MLEARPLEEVLGPYFGAKVTAIIARYPPKRGELVELSPDQRHVRWTAADGSSHEVEIIPTVIDESDDDDGEDDDTGWEDEVTPIDALAEELAGMVDPRRRAS